MTGRRIISVLALLMLAGCGSSPRTQYFTLAVAPGTGEDHRAMSSPVTVASVNLPASLDRSAMVRRTGANTMAVSGQDRWAAPLDDMIRRVLSQDLAMHLPKDDVVLPDSPLPPRTARIVVSIAEFDADAGGKVVLNGSWSLLEGDQQKPVLSREVALETGSVAADDKGEAAGMSRLLGELAAEIAETLASTPRHAAGKGEKRASETRAAP
jgi:uncharacterized protein